MLSYVQVSHMMSGKPSRCHIWSILSFVFISVLLSSCSGEKEHGMHRGEKALGTLTMTLDSMVVNADTTSLQGNFVLADEGLIFIDRGYSKAYIYSPDSGELLKAHLGRGQGPNEVNGAMEGFTVSPADTSVWIMDSMMGIYEYSPKNATADYTTRIDFGWGDEANMVIDKPGVYAFLDLTGFGATVTQINDSTMLIPVNILKRNLSVIDEDYYNRGHIFGEVDIPTLKVRKVTGKFPEFFKEHPCPALGYFDYEYEPESDRVFVTYGADSLIYCYQYPDSLLFTFGFEPEGIKREYPFGYDVDFNEFVENPERIGFNTRLMYDREKKLYLRVSIKERKSYDSVVQVYDKDFNLVGELDLPPMFVLLGKHGSKYYGIRRDPIEYEDKSEFVFYTFTLEP